MVGVEKDCGHEPRWGTFSPDLDTSGHGAGNSIKLRVYAVEWYGAGFSGRTPKESQDIRGYGKGNGEDGGMATGSGMGDGYSDGWGREDASGCDREFMLDQIDKMPCLATDWGYGFGKGSGEGTLWGKGFADLTISGHRDGYGYGNGTDSGYRDGTGCGDGTAPGAGASDDFEHEETRGNG